MENIDIFYKLKALGIKDISQLEKGNIQYWWNEKYKQIIASNIKVKTNPFSDEILKINLFKEELQAIEIEDLKSILEEGKLNKDWQKKISLNQETSPKNQTQNFFAKNLNEFKKKRILFLSGISILFSIGFLYSYGNLEKKIPFQGQFITEEDYYENYMDNYVERAKNYKTKNKYRKDKLIYNTSSSSSKCKRTEYFEEYIPGNRLYPGYVRSYEKILEIPCD